MWEKQSIRIWQQEGKVRVDQMAKDPIDNRKKLNRLIETKEKN